MNREGWIKTKLFPPLRTTDCVQSAIEVPLKEDRYTGIVKAVLTAKHNKNGDDYYDIAHAGLSVVNSPPFFFSLDCKNTKHKGAMDHYLS